MLGLLVAVVLGAIVLGGVAQGLFVRGGAQGAADLAALAGARALGKAHPGVFAPPTLGGRPNPAHVDRAAYLDAGRRAALATARRNGADQVRVTFPGERGELAPLRVRVEVSDPIEVGSEAVPSTSAAEAELVLGAVDAVGGSPGAGEYRGPFATRQGKRMRPDVALGFDRLAAAARAAGHELLITSAFRSDAEQAVLFAARPDPKWVARPGTSLHRLGTELDLGPPSAYAWLAANAGRFHFLKRYSWEPWHFGWTLNASSSVRPTSRARGAAAGTTRAGADDAGQERDDAGGGAGDDDAAGGGATPPGRGDRGGGLPGFVPERFAPMIARAAQRWNVSGVLLAAQLHQESGFNPNAVSKAGAQGIAQFMPATARGYGLSNPFDPAASIDAQAHLMRDLLRQFGAVPLALAAYNAGPAPVQRCGCVPPYRETQNYVATILALMRGAGFDAVIGAGLEVRLVR
jgi:hypothetical protein